MAVIDLSGQRYGRLSVITLAGTDKRGEARWECICDCGNKHIVLSSHLRSGRVRSCGCLAKEKAREAIMKIPNRGHYTHRGSKTRLYQIWVNMKTRCLNQNNRAYKWYGEKGVSICPEWMRFENFMRWAFESGYQSNLTIERKDPFGNYEPSNCTWIPKSEQRKNQRRSKQWQD